MILFIIVGVFVNVGFNTEQQVIGLANWKIRGAPFVGGFGGFARVFVTASFACTPMFILFSITALTPSEQLGAQKVWVSPQERQRILLRICLVSSTLCSGGQLLACISEVSIDIEVF